MKATVQISTLRVGLDQPKYPGARVAIVETENGARYLSLMVGSTARPAAGQPQVDAELAQIPVAVNITDAQAEWLLTPRPLAEHLNEEESPSCAA